MRYASAHRTWLSTGPALTADDRALGAWLRLAAHAADIEFPEPAADDVTFGEGRIPACLNWPDRAWAAATGTDSSGVAAAVEAGLARWEGADLLVSGYDLDGQRQVWARRENGKKGGRPKSAEKPTGIRQDNLPVSDGVTQAEPERNPSPNLTSPNQDPPKGGGLVDPPGFSEFWQDYPRKVGKGAARKAWRRLKPPLGAILVALAWQRRSPDWQKDGGQYIPHPATYLNETRWEDEPPATAKKQANPWANPKNPIHAPAVPPKRLDPSEAS